MCEALCVILQETVFPGGLALRADVTLASTADYVRNLRLPKPRLIDADPPYGDIVKEGWDSVDRIIEDRLRLHPLVMSDRSLAREQCFIAWMIDWTKLWSPLLDRSGAFHVWGGVGRPGFRPFYGFLQQAERATGLTLVNHITWKKKRGYGTATNLLFTREEIAWFCWGDPRKDHVFNVPLLDVRRGYPGYDPKHPAKSEFKRRTNVWDDTVGCGGEDCDWSVVVMDETEILRNKRGPCEKCRRVCEIPIETHTKAGDLVLNLFAGTGSLSKAANGLRRHFIAIENGQQEFDDMTRYLGE